MPMAPHVDVVVGDDDEVKRAGRDGSLTAGAHVLLASLIGLNRRDGYVEKRAQAMTANVATTASTTMTMSRTDLSCSRNGLNPTPRRYLRQAVV